MNNNLYQHLHAAMDAQGDKPALRLTPTSQVSYARLLERVAQLAAELRVRSVTPGERVLAQIDKSVANVALYLATLRIGAVYVPINTGYTLAEVRYFLEDAEPALLVVDDPLAYADLQTAMQAVGTKLAQLGGYPEDQMSAPESSLVAGTAAPLAATDVAITSAADTAAILYTSGTTGRSKGAMLSHSNLLSNARVLEQYWHWQPDDVLLHALPIFHVHGLFVALHCALLGGSTMVFRPKFDAADVLEWLPQCTVMMGVPTFYTRLLLQQGFDANVCSTMRLFISGSAPLTEQTFAEFESRTGHRILERYGMSEALMITSNPYQGERVAGTVGFALPDIDVRVVNSEGAPAATGEVGVIELRGPNVFSGYWRMPEKTAAEFRADGFFISGDLGTCDAHGRIAIVGREKDLVISGGYNVYPKEVERLLDEMASVQESAVIGVPHADFGEAVVAVVVPADPAVPVTTAQVNEYLSDQIARYKQPKIVLCLDELPRNAMGKVQKKALRETNAQLFADSIAD